MEILKEEDSRIICRSGSQVLFEYIYRPEIPSRESPKPYFHPLRTLSGTVVTDFRPEDHVHHHGLSMTLTQVDHHNFWGGKTYRKENGKYLDLPCNGHQQHQSWNLLESSDEQVVMDEMVDWISIDSERLLSDRRRFTVSQVNLQDSSYLLDAEFEIRNMSGRALTLGNWQSVEGLEGSFYTGLVFRAAKGFCDPAALMAAGGLEGVDAIHGNPGSWMALEGIDAESGSESTVILIDQPGNPGYPNRWFVRWGHTQAAFPMESDEPMMLPTDGTLRLHCKLVIADGAWSRNQIEAKVASGL